MQFRRVWIGVAVILLGSCAGSTGIDLRPYQRAPSDVPGITTRLEVAPSSLDLRDSLDFKMWAHNHTSQRIVLVHPCGPPMDAVFSSREASAVSVLQTRAPGGIFTCQGYTVDAFDSLLVSIRIKSPTRRGTYQAVTGLRSDGLSNLSAPTTFQIH